MSGGNFNKLGHLEKNIKNGRVDSSETDFNILFWLGPYMVKPRGWYNLISLTTETSPQKNPTELVNLTYQKK